MPHYEDEPPPAAPAPPPPAPAGRPAGPTYPLIPVASLHRPRHDPADLARLLGVPPPEAGHARGPH